MAASSYLLSSLLHLCKLVLYRDFTIQLVPRPSTYSPLFITWVSEHTTDLRDRLQSVHIQNAGGARTMDFDRLPSGS